MKNLLIVLSFLLLSCESQKKAAARTQAAMDSWIGLSKQQVIMGNGLPLKTGDDGAGGEVLLFGKQFYMRNAYTGNKVIWAYKIFFIDRRDKVYHWRIEKSEVPPQQYDVNLRFR